MSHIYAVIALFAAGCFYASVPHVRWPWPQSRRWLQAAGGLLTMLAILAALPVLRFWPGFFAVLVVLMLGFVTLPYLKAWRGQARGGEIERVG